MKQWLVFIAGMVMVSCVPQKQVKESTSQPIVSTQEQLMESGEHLSEASNYFDQNADYLENMAKDLEILAENTSDPETATQIRQEIVGIRERVSLNRARSEAMQREASRALDVASDRSIDE